MSEIPVELPRGTCPAHDDLVASVAEIKVGQRTTFQRVDDLVERVDDLVELVVEDLRTRAQLQHQDAQDRTDARESRHQLVRDVVQAVRDVAVAALRPATLLQLVVVVLALIVAGSGISVAYKDAVIEAATDLQSGDGAGLLYDTALEEGP